MYNPGGRAKRFNRPPFPNKKNMKKYIFLMSLLVAGTLGFLSAGTVAAFAQGSTPSSNPVQEKPLSVLLVERDVPQTRVDFEPVVNHGALVANLSDETIEVDIESPIPQGLYVVKKFFPTFGHDSLLAMPMQFPQKVAISEYKTLDRPLIDTKNNETVFRWENISIPAKQAVIAQYDNYFGPRSQFYTKDGLKILELDIRTSFKASSIDGGKGVVFELYYDMENKGKEEIEDILMDVILPDSVYVEEEKPPVQLFEVADAVASPQVNIMRGMLGDGFGKAAVGTIFTVDIRSIQPGSSHNIWMKVMGKNIAKEGDSYPLLTFQYRTKGNPIWPPTILRSKKKLEITRYSYRHANLILPDNKLFRFEPDGIKVFQINGL
ncbi:MAG TPA: hypothetical protein DDY17_02535 [Syntrophaceae bacterium]|nr:hypothetical protein [Syntrophaceae bacterium]